MSIFSHAVIGSNDIARSKSFYDAVLGPLGLTYMGDYRPGMIMYGKDVAGFFITTPLDGKSATAANGATLGFAAPSLAAVDAFYKQALANGGTCEGPPGPRAAPGSYAAYVRDPDLNKIVAWFEPA